MPACACTHRARQRTQRFAFWVIHRQLKALSDRQQRRGWVAPEQTQYPTSKLCDPEQQPSFNTGIVWFGILVQDTKKRTFFMLYLRRLKLIFFWQSALLYKRYLVQETKQCWKINNLSWKCKSPLSALSAMLTSTSCNYAAWPLTAHLISKEKYSSFLGFFACAFSFQIQGDAASPVQTYFHGCGCQLLHSLLYSFFWWRKVGQRGKKNQGGLVEHGKILQHHQPAWWSVARHTTLPSHGFLCWDEDWAMNKQQITPGCYFPVLCSGR